MPGTAGACCDRVQTVYLVFSQAPTVRLDLAELLRHVQRYFPGWELEVLSESVAAAGAPLPEALTTEFELRRGASPQRAQLCCRVRRATPPDHERAIRAEERGRAGGMAALARRCLHVAEVWPGAESLHAADPQATRLPTHDGAPSVELLTFCAMLASVTLGPVLPPDDSTLFGVRGARERAEALAGGRSLLR